MSDTANDIIRATSDIFIASLLSAPENEPILRGLINAVLKNSGAVLVKSTEVLNPINVKEFVFDKGIVLDVRVKDERDQIFNIEIQTSPHPAFVERILFGWADTFSAQLHAGNAYTKLQPVFCIVITEFNIFPGEKGVHFVFELRDRKRRNLKMSNHLEIHFLRLYEVLTGQENVLENESPEFRHLTNFLAFGGTKGDDEMAQLLENDPVMMDAVGELRRFSSDPEMRELERRRKLWKLEHLSGLTAEREAGIAEGEARGEARGVIRTLTKRFGSIPRRVSDRVLAIGDSVVLDSLAEYAFDCQTLDEFAKSLK